MRILKKKIALKSNFNDANSNVQIKAEEASIVNTASIKQEILSLKEDPLPLRGPRKNRTPADADSKNIVKNYGKALCAFASSKIAQPYIENIIMKQGNKDINVGGIYARYERKERDN